jgi:threonine/homoserine/homoserine lactone efflux protein
MADGVMASPKSSLWDRTAAREEALLLENAVLSLSAFALAVLLLLFTPGPTNTLLAVAGASRGLKASLPLVGAELGGYLTTIAILVFFAAPMLADRPTAALIVKLVSTLWVLLLAIRLWSHPPTAADPGAVRANGVFATTVLNPKGLIIGLALIPPAVAGTRGGLAAPLPYIALFSGLVVLVALSWLTFGAKVLSRVAVANPLLFGRVAASFLVLFAASLAGRAIGWI